MTEKKGKILNRELGIVESSLNMVRKASFSKTLLGNVYAIAKSRLNMKLNHKTNFQSYFLSLSYNF